MNSIYDYTLSSIDGEDISLGQFKGKVLLIVNVASQCGLTPQYEGLQRLYDQFEKRGFCVLAFPCNQFGGQEPGSAREIKSFATEKFHVSFPLFAKLDVNGPHTAGLFKFLKESLSSDSEDIEWNFAKFLVDQKGQVVERFSPTTVPADLEAKIDQLLS